jgi:hypothetical protein
MLKLKRVLTMINMWITYGKPRLYSNGEFDLITNPLWKNKGNAKRGVSPRLTIWPCDLDLWSMTLKINRVPDSKDYVYTKFGQNPLKDVDSRVFTRMLSGKIWPLDLWPWKSIGFQTLIRTKYVPSLVKIHWMMLILVFTRMSHGKNLTRWPCPLTCDLENQ